jgi:hypothetical protein
VVPSKKKKKKKSVIAPMKELIWITIGTPVQQVVVFKH